MIAIFFDNDVELDQIAKHSQMHNAWLMTERERQNQLDDMMGWQRGWREPHINRQTIQERLAYLYDPRDCMTEQERQICREQYNDLVQELTKKINGGN